MSGETTQAHSVEVEVLRLPAAVVEILDTESVRSCSIPEQVFIEFMRECWPGFIRRRLERDLRAARPIEVRRHRGKAVAVDDRLALEVTP